MQLTHTNTLLDAKAGDKDKGGAAGLPTHRITALAYSRNNAKLAIANQVCSCPPS